VLGRHTVKPSQQSGSKQGLRIRLQSILLSFMFIRTHHHPLAMNGILGSTASTPSGIWLSSDRPPSSCALRILAVLFPQQPAIQPGPYSLQNLIARSSWIIQVPCRYLETGTTARRPSPTSALAEGYHLALSGYGACTAAGTVYLEKGARWNR
jgi:hypothetical protein